MKQITDGRGSGILSSIKSFWSSVKSLFYRATAEPSASDDGYAGPIPLPPLAPAVRYEETAIDVPVVRARRRESNPTCFLECELPAVDKKLYDCLFLSFSQVDAPLRIVISAPDISEHPVAEMTVTARAEETFKLLGLHGFPAIHPCKLTIRSSIPFDLEYLDVRHMWPPFRNEDGVMKFHDSRFADEPIPTVWPGNHHRLIGGPGKDVGYSGGGRA